MLHFLIAAIQNAVTCGIWIVHEYRVDWITVTVNPHTMDFAITKISVNSIADLKQLSLSILRSDFDWKWEDVSCMLPAARLLHNGPF